MTSTNQTKIAEILDHYQIKFIQEDKLELEPDQDLSIIPNETIVNILGIKNDEGHQIFVEKLHQIEINWLTIFLKYESHYDVYNIEGEVIIHNFYLLIYEILDGLL